MWLASKHEGQRAEPCDHAAIAGSGQEKAGLKGAGAVGTTAVTDSQQWLRSRRKGGPWDQPCVLSDIYKSGLYMPWTASDIYSLSRLMPDESIKWQTHLLLFIFSFSFYMMLLVIPF